jgi:hypothetical protein
MNSNYFYKNIKRMFKIFKDPNKKYKTGNNTLLTSSVINGNKKSVLFLLRKGSDINLGPKAPRIICIYNHKICYMIMTPLLLSIRYFRFHILKILIKHGALNNVNIDNLLYILDDCEDSSYRKIIFKTNFFVLWIYKHTKNKSELENKLPYDIIRETKEYI